MLFEFEDSTLEPIYEKVNAGTRLSYEDGVTLGNPTIYWVWDIWLIWSGKN